MLHVPSWKWLSFRPTRQMIGETPPSRPCLPAVEKLDDRLMLSATPDAAASTDGGNEGVPNGDTQILIGLLRGQLGVVSDELNIIKLAGDLKLDTHKLTDSFLKIDDVIYKLGEAQIKGDLTGIKLDKTISDLKIEFQKIDMLVGGLGAEDYKIISDQISSLKVDTSSIIGVLSKAVDGGDLSHKIELTYLKLSENFLKLDGALLKLQSGIVEDKQQKADVEYLKIKLEDILISSLKLDNGDLQKEIQGIADATVGLLNPAGFDGGVTTDGGDTGDVLA
jgi:hypothetical protein